MGGRPGLASEVERHGWELSVFGVREHLGECPGRCWSAVGAELQILELNVLVEVVVKRQRGWRELFLHAASTNCPLRARSHCP